MNVEQNQINENRSIEEILLTSDEEDSSENFIDIETPDSNILNFSKNLNSSEISNSEQGNTSKNSILMLNDSSLKKTPPTPSLKFITHESDTDSFQTPDILHKSINSKKIDTEEIEFCYVNSESENEPYGEETFSNNTFQYIKNAKENICENSSELSYELCRKASTKLITVKKVDSFLVSKQNLKDFPTINKLNTKLPVSDSIQTLDLNENEISTNEKEIDDEMTSTPQFNSQSVNSLRSSLFFPSMNDPKLRMQCFVRLKKMDEDVFKFYRFDKYKQRAKKKKKISITYKSFNGVLSDDESGNSNSSTEWSISSNRKRKPKNKSALEINLNNNLNAAKSSSSTSIRNINSISSPSPSLSVNFNLNESDKKKSKRSLNENELEILQKKSKKNSHLFLNDNIAQILNEDTNLGFDTNQDTFEVSHVQDGKLKIKKCSKMILQNNDEPSTALIDSEITKDSLNLNENSNSNITIVLSSSRSCSPIPELNEKIDERIKKPKKRVVDDLESDLSNQSNDSYEKKIEKPIVKIIKKSENLLKTTLKKATNNETVLINKQIGKISKSLESEQHRKEKENAPIKQNNDKVIRKNVEKDTNGSINKNQKPNETKMTNTNTENITERPKPFKIPKLNRQNDKIEDTIIKPQKNNLKDTKTNNHLVKKQNVKNETKSLKKDAKNIVNKKKEKSSDKVHKNNNNSNNNSNKKQNSNNEINKLMSSIPDNNNNNNNNHNNNHNNINDNNNKKLINKSMKILDKIKKRNIPTLNDLNQKRIAYNKSIGANYPYFSLLYLMDEYVKKMSTVACLDFNLLISYLPPNEDPELSVTNLDQNKQIQLCKLISRSAGKINIFKLFGLDCLLREYPRRYEPTAANFSKSLNDDEYFLSILNNLSLSQAVIVYKRFLSQLNTPFRIVDTARIANTNYETLIIKFENDFQVDSYDLSIESVVFSSLHKENKKFKVINNVLHQNYVCEQDLNQVSSNQSNNIKNDKLIIKPDSYDYIRKQVKDDQLLDKMFTKTCFEKVVRLKMPENFYMVCQSQINKKSKKEANINKKERFLNHVTSTRSDRGKMRIAEKHKVISDHEFNYRLKKLQNEHDIQVDLSNLFKDKN